MNCVVAPPSQPDLVVTQVYGDQVNVVGGTGNSVFYATPFAEISGGSGTNNFIFDPANGNSGNQNLEGVPMEAIIKF